MSSLKSVIVKLGEKEVGKIGLTPAGTCAFEYSEDFIKNGRSISPFELPLKQGVFLAKPEPFYGGFGFFMIPYLMDGVCWCKTVIFKVKESHPITETPINYSLKFSFILAILDDKDLA